jgi:hypothetical protein
VSITTIRHGSIHNAPALDAKPPAPD